MKKLSLLLTLCLILTSVCTLFSMTVSAETYVAEIRDGTGAVKKSMTLDDLKAVDLNQNYLKLDAGESFNLLANVDLGSASLFAFKNCGNNVTINGNGYEVKTQWQKNQDNKTPDAALFVEAAGTVTVNNLKVTGGDSSSSYGIKCGANTTLILNNVTMKCGYKGVVASGDNATIIINGGSYDAGAACLCLEGVANPTLKVNNASVKNTTERSIIVNAVTSCKVDVVGGYFVSCEKPVMDIRGNTKLNVYGGYFERRGMSNPMISDNGASGNTFNFYGGTFVARDIKNLFNVGQTPCTVVGANIYNFMQDEGGKIVSAGSPDFKAITVALAMPTAETPDITSTIAGLDPDNSILYTHTTMGGVKKKTISMDAPELRGLSEQKDGIRFTGEISKDMIDLAKAEKDDATELSYGTLIAPKDYLTGLFAFTIETLEKAGKSYKNVEATSAGMTVNEDGSITLRAGLTSIQSGNADREFCAVSYVKYVKDGHDVYVYGVYDADQAVALNDLVD